MTVAKRELLEETGYVSDDWQYIGATVESSAKLTNYMHLFFANHCRKVSEQNLDPTEKIIRVFGDSRLKKCLGQNARRYAEKNVSKAEAVEQYIKSIERLVDKEK